MTHDTQGLGLNLTRLRYMAPWTMLNQIFAGALGLMFFGWVGLMVGALLVQLIGLLLAIDIKLVPATPKQATTSFSPINIVLLPVGVLLGLAIVIAGAAYSVSSALLSSSRN